MISETSLNFILFFIKIFFSLIEKNIVKRINFKSNKILLPPSWIARLFLWERERERERESACVWTNENIYQASISTKDLFKPKVGTSRSIMEGQAISVDHS